MEGLNESERQWIDRLKSPEYGQSHLIDQFPADASATQIKAFIGQIQTVDTTYPGGLLAYIQRARNLLKESKEGLNPFEGYTPEVPVGVALITGDSEFRRYENLGLEHLRGVSFVLVAGGLGERLGYADIKIGLPCETLTEMTYCEYYIRTILAMQNYCNSKSEKPIELPLAIMTSGDTHARTVKLLKDNHNFGMKENQVTIMKQEKVPALLDNEARIAAEPDNPFGIQTKPHGHGDVHTLLKQTGLARKWVNEGRTHCVFFQDTNSLVFHALPAALGVSYEKGFCMNSLTVPRRPGEAAGGICALKNTKTGETLTINVEYNQLDPLLRATGDKQGDVAGPDGNSKFPGNINVLLVALSRYADILDETHGSIPEFVNPKYATSEKIAFKSPTRLECMMQDFPKLLSKTDKAGFTQFDRWLCFSTVKNNTKDAGVKAKQNLPPDCAFSGESDHYSCNARLMEIAAKLAGVKEVCIAKPEKATYLDVDYYMGPHIVLMPSFGFCLELMKQKLGKGPFKIAQGSSLILEGNVLIDGFDLKGGFSGRATGNSKLCIKNMQVSNDGYVVERLADENSENIPLHQKIRGYKLVARNVCELSAN